jgi:4-diphosphocytidyl-2-C-methyl-D-erythritol kinase
MRPDGHITREDLASALPAQDLVLRAALALQAASGCTAGAHIAVEKRIPQRSGMGGGSSDAASCLLALNRLWKLRLPLETLLDIGLTLGADVPFFLRGRNAWVQGIGEQMEPLKLPQAVFRVAKPPSGLDTAAVFQSADLGRNTPTAIISGFAEDPYGFGRNDLQPVAKRLCPEVEEALRWFETQGLKGRMTGSGSAVFARLERGTQVAATPEGWEIRECGNLEVHPLMNWA